MKHRRVVTRAAGRIEHALGRDTDSNSATIERGLVRQSLRPVDHRFVTVRQVFEEGCGHADNPPVSGTRR